VRERCRLAIALLLGSASVAICAPPPATTTATGPAPKALSSGKDRWLSGPELKRQLTVPVGMSWTGTPFRQALQALSQSRQVAVLLDRRVDPDANITLSLPPAPLEEALSRVARERNADVTQFGPVAYVGPPRVARRLRTLAALRTQDAQRLPADARKPLLSVRPFAWDDLATPRELIGRLAAEAGVAIEGQQLVPHDLWAGQSLPAMSWVDRLTLLAAQFDLTFQIDPTGRLVQLSPTPDEVVIERSYPGGGSAADRARRWRELAPEAKIELAAGRIIVRGRLEDHERLSRSAAPAAPAKRPGIEVHTLVVRQTPLDKLLEQFEKKLDLRFEWDQAALQRAGISMAANVSVDVKNVTLDELLSAALTPAGLSFQREGRVVKIRPHP
jgi:Secretin and TonB N terminus short domain